MKFTINKIELLEALTVTGKAISTSGILPILSSYLFAISDDKILITGGSNEIAIKYSLEIAPCGITKTIAILKGKLFDLISDSPNQPIDFEIFETEVDGKVQPSKVKIKTNIGEYFLPVVSGDDYPHLSIQNPSTFSVPKSSLVKGIESTLFAVSNDDSRPAITGVYFHFDAGNMVCASTDRFVVASKTLPLTDAVPERRSMILPKRILTILLGMPSEDDIEVMVTDKNIRFAVSQTTTVESILIEAQFPAYLDVIPTDQPNHLVIRKNQLLSSIKRVNRFAEMSTSQIIIQIYEGNINVSAYNDFGDKADENMSIDYEGGGVRIGMSGKFMLESLNRINTDNVSISFNGPADPFVLRDSDEHTAVNTKQNMIMVMPQTLDN